MGGTHFTGEKMNTEPSREGGGGVKKEGAEARSGELFFLLSQELQTDHRATDRPDRWTDR